MSTTSAPFGFRPVQNYPGTVRPNETIDGITSGNSTAIYVGQPVNLSSGKLTAVTATSDKIFAIFAGCKFLASATASTYTYGYWPASQAYVAGTMSTYYYDDPGQIYEVQANGSVAATALGSQVLTNSVTSGSTTTGLSQAMVVNTTVGNGVQGQFLIVGVQQAPDNAWGDNYTIVRVKVAYPQVYPSTTSLA